MIDVFYLWYYTCVIKTNRSKHNLVKQHARILHVLEFIDDTNIIAIEHALHIRWIGGKIKCQCSGNRVSSNEVLYVDGHSA